MQNELDLASIYESILNPKATPVVLESSAQEEEEEEVPAVKEGFKKKKKAFGGKGKPSKEEAGKKYLGDSNDYTSLFKQHIQRIDEEFGFGGQEDDNSFDFDGGEEGGDDFGGGGDEEFGDEEGQDAESVLRNVYEILKGYFGDGGEEEYEDDGFGGEDEFGAGDTIPSESYAHEGDGQEHGDQGTYDGKAKVQPKTNLVKANGDVEFGKQKTGYKPGESGRGAAKSHGGQGTYNDERRLPIILSV